MVGRTPVFAGAIGALLALNTGSCLDAREQPAPVHRSNCTTCHGSPVRGADNIVNAAPPFDLSGNTDPRSPGVGAHLVHLLANDLHDGVACEECHLVPEATDSVGHADSALPAELIFGDIARASGRDPIYSPESHGCTDSYCHMAGAPNWTAPTVAENRCERCHGMPPAAPHPPSDECFRCHSDVIDAAQHIVDTSRHVNGVVDVEDRCDRCHGTGPEGAPPPDLFGSSDISSIGVGAHETHLSGTAWSRAVSCESCHIVPVAASDLGHLDSDRPAEVQFAGVAIVNGQVPEWNRATRSCSGGWCHGPAVGGASPSWTQAAALGCDSCHGNPPSAPHPQLSDCATCHGEVINAQGQIISPTQHVNGVVNVDVPAACNACHGDATSPAPPMDLDGNLGEMFAGVGAHRVHLEGSGIARTVLCSECHAVPSDVLDTGHLDSLGPAELKFSGVAIAFGASPQYAGGSCADSYCHGGQFVLGHASGGMVTEPVWTLVDGSQAQCDSCHGLPPPAPHPPGPSFCSDCHPNVGVTLEILDPTTHVDGHVDLLDGVLGQ